MPATLRKACHACTRAKRKCLPRLPACERCAKRQVPCVYDLEPVVQSWDSSDSTPDSSSHIVLDTGASMNNVPLSIIYDSVSTARDASIAALADGQSLDSAAARPMLVADGEIKAWLLAFFTQMAKDGTERKSPMIHSYLLNLPNHPGQGTRQGLDLQARLIEVHALMTTALKQMLLERPSNKKDLEIEDIVTRLFSATKSLWSEAPNEMSSLFEPWQAWLTAESIRRSMFAAIMVRGLWHVAAYGHCYFEPLLESMPFDPRAGIWEAQTPEEWHSATEKRGGTHTKLKSWHEFITDTSSKAEMHARLDPSEDGMFQRLLFVCYHGSNGIRALEKNDFRAGPPCQ